VLRDGHWFFERAKFLETDEIFRETGFVQEKKYKGRTKYRSFREIKKFLFQKELFKIVEKN